MIIKKSFFYFINEAQIWLPGRIEFPIHDGIEEEDIYGSRDFIAISEHIRKWKINIWKRQFHRGKRASGKFRKAYFQIRGIIDFILEGNRFRIFRKSSSPRIARQLELYKDKDWKWR